MKIVISCPGYPSCPPVTLVLSEGEIPSTWYGELARSYFRDLFFGSTYRANTMSIRVEDDLRAYTFGLVVRESLDFEVTGA